MRKTLVDRSESKVGHSSGSTLYIEWPHCKVTWKLKTERTNHGDTEQMEPITIAHVVRSGFHDMTLFKILR